MLKGMEMCTKLAIILPRGGGGVPTWYRLAISTFPLDDDVVCDDGSFWAQPPLMEDCFSTGFLQQFLVSEVENTEMFNYLL
ncbi:hypothetical protein L1987_22219 [Smallanthus sonchifolius]|uniref:Uncharacterized protein n=1 Tax=Smallanthus sonchifolius TaxID=185202 RepID=A0ACB9IFQ8_9ASTR|nr:hypothetical protein L1987_22219 [Smallanthus sonchifolius]